MATKEYKQMIQRGKWLEEFLNPELKSWNYKRLAIEFIDMYQVDFKFSKNDLSIQFLEEMETKSNIAASSEQNVDSGKQLDNSTRAHIMWRLNMEKQFTARKLIMEAFQVISSSPKPWGYHLSEKNQRTPRGKLILGQMVLVDFYNHLIEKLDIGEDNLLFKRVFKGTTEDLVNDGQLQIGNHDHQSCFRWNIAISRMFFDFLFLGGQEYFLFCKQCGNFSVIERKGRKLFCSDVCKTRFRTANLP